MAYRYVICIMCISSYKSFMVEISSLSKHAFVQIGQNAVKSYSIYAIITLHFRFKTCAKPMSQTYRT